MIQKTRTESDLIGSVKLPADSLSGIHSLRAKENFPISRRPVNQYLIRAVGAVKLAAVTANYKLGYIHEDIFPAIERACNELYEGLLDDDFELDALQGGAGTSTNMAVNEVIANRALQILNDEPGNYEKISPIEHINLHQSTNDVYPTALKISAIERFRILEQSVVSLVETFQLKEKEFADVVKVGRTQMQEAVLTTLGREMGAYADAIARDRWRIYKCEERLRVINLGGTAIGTGITAPRQYIFRISEELKTITGIGLARAENMIEATQNNDVFVEVSGILKAYASTLFKVANDLRFMSSSPQEINLPARQTGSSIMPNKVNPVIPEAVMQTAMVVFGNDQVITQAVSQGNLELNAFLPLIADKLLENLDLLVNVTDVFRSLCIEGIEANREKCTANVANSTATITALVEKIGYKTATEIGQIASQSQKSIKKIILEKKLLTEAEFEHLISPEHVNRLGSK